MHFASKISWILGQANQVAFLYFQVLKLETFCVRKIPNAEEM
jgi:hypothetical protein